MSGFLFNRQPVQTKGVPPALTRNDLDRALQAVLEAQSITASAIFALLVSKGVLTTAEAAAYMREIGEVLQRDVAAPIGTKARKTIAAYGDALARADP